MGKLALAGATVWNRASYDELRAACRDFKPEVVHFHNTFPLISPAGYKAARDEGAAVIQTLHNYRFLCAGATFYRDNGVCDTCLHKRIKWPAALHKCYRGNRGASVVTAAMLSIHRLRGTYTNLVDRYIALSEFARGKFIEGGLPANRIIVKPNFVDPDPGEGSGDGNYMLFVGRLTEEKGVQTLLDAWQQVSPDVKLKIVGDGPMKQDVERCAAALPNVEYLGRKSQTEVAELMGAASALIFPSVWYEGMPRTIIESFAKGTPVIASNLGTMSSMIQHADNGWKFRPGDANELATLINGLHETNLLKPARAHARWTYVHHYGGEANYQLLMHIYGHAKELR